MAGAAGTGQYNPAGNSDFSRKAMELAEQMLGMWTAPKTLTGGANSNRAARGAGGPDLQEQAEQWAPDNWPAPATRDHKGSSEGSITRQDGKSRADMLDFAAEQFFPLTLSLSKGLPPSSPAQPIAAGSMSSTAGPNSNQPSVRRKLNPLFVEALMRWPTGLSGFARPETAWTRWWQQQLSFLSALVSSAARPDQGSLFE